MGQRGSWLVSGAAVLAALLVSPAGVEAATFTVTPGSPDSSDATPDGSCDDGLGVCSLREAVEEANALAGDDRINLPAGTFQLTIGGAGEDLGASGDLDVRDGIRISGAGSGQTTIDQMTADRVFHIPPAAASGDVYEFDNLTITGGAVIGSGGGLLSERGSALSLSRVIVDGNTALSASGFVSGGGLAAFTSAASTTISESTLRNNNVTNTAVAPTGSDVAQGGGLYVSGVGATSLTMTASTIGPGNQSLMPTAPGQAFGGGLVANTAVAGLERTRVRGNTAGTGGGLVRGASGGLFTLERSTVDGNASNGSSGGGALIFTNLSSPALIRNSTISANTSAVDGGGIRISGGGSATLEQTTIAGNAGGGGPGGSGDGISVVSAAVGLDRVLLDNGGTNTTDNCSVSSGSYSKVGSGNSLIRDSDVHCTFVGDVAGDPLLGPLDDNGGPIHTHALAAASPARDVAAGCNPLVLIDQRGFARPGVPTAGCDAGAFEYADTDADGIEDGVDLFPNDPDNDIDGDGISGDIDNCPADANPGQADGDGDGAGDACDPFPNDPDDDADGDGVSGDIDNCPADANPGQQDADGDGIGDVCDPTPDPGPDPIAGLDLTAKAKKKLKAGKPIKVKVSCPKEDCSVSGRATFSLPAGGKASTAKKLKTKRVRKDLQAGESKRLKLKLAGKDARKLKRRARAAKVRKRSKVVARINASDGSGDRAKAKLKLKLKG